MWSTKCSQIEKAAKLGRHFLSDGVNPTHVVILNRYTGENLITAILTGLVAGDCTVSVLLALSWTSAGSRTMDKQATIDFTQRWIAKIVIGLNLCPFARRVFEGELVRYVVTEAADEETLRGVLASELKTLSSVPISQIETTIIIHPRVLTDFLDYNDFLLEADRLLGTLKLSGMIQIASFHPQYQFEGTSSDSVENYSNRSPFPMLHLLREESITRVVHDPVELEKIPQRNIETLRNLGIQEILEQLKAVQSNGE